MCLYSKIQVLINHTSAQVRLLYRNNITALRKPSPSDFTFLLPDSVGQVPAYLRNLNCRLTIKKKLNKKINMPIAQTQNIKYLHSQRFLNTSLTNDNLLGYKLFQHLCLFLLSTARTSAQASPLIC